MHNNNAKRGLLIMLKRTVGWSY